MPRGLDARREAEPSIQIGRRSLSWRLLRRCPHRRYSAPRHMPTRRIRTKRADALANRAAGDSSGFGESQRGGDRRVRVLRGLRSVVVTGNRRQQRFAHGRGQLDGDGVVALDEPHDGFAVVLTPLVAPVERIELLLPLSGGRERSDEAIVVVTVSGRCTRDHADAEAPEHRQRAFTDEAVELVGGAGHELVRSDLEHRHMACGDGQPLVRLRPFAQTIVAGGRRARDASPPAPATAATAR